MRWPELTLKQLLAVAMALYLVLSLAAVHGALLNQPSTTNTSDNTTVADVEDTTVANTTPPPSPYAIHQQNGTATLNCSTLAARSLPPDSGPPATIRNTSRPVLPASYNASTQGTGTNLAAPVGPSTGNGTPPATEMRRAVPASVRETCRLIEQYSPPEWVTKMAATRAATNSNPTPDNTSNSVEAYRNRSEIAAAQLALARDLRDIFTDDSRSRREATFAAAELALAERKQAAVTRQVNVSELPEPVVKQLKQRGVSANEQLDTTLKPQLAVQQTNLRGANDLLTTAETVSTGEAHSLSETTRLTETAIKVQVARQQTDTQPVDPSDVPLSTSTVSIPDHDTPIAATVAILEAQDTELTDVQAAELQALGALPVSIRQELTDVLDAYLVYYRAVEASNGTDVQRVRAAQLQLLEAAADLETALDDSASQGLVRPIIQIEGIVSIDLSRSHNTYTEDYVLQIDAGGHDTYNNNAGGANASGKSTDVAALIDLGGSDTYNGRNGGGQYLVTEESPSEPSSRVDDVNLPKLPKKGEATGFLLDAGAGDDTYNAEAHGSNGGGRRGIGFLVDTGGDDTYNGSGKATNGAGRRKGAGFLMDVGTGSDTYNGGQKGVSNGGANYGHAFLFDMGGNDIYTGWNGAAQREVIHNYLTRLHRQCVTDPREENLRDPVCRILIQSPLPFPSAPRRPSGGFLLDGGGTDTYNGTNTARGPSSNGAAGIRAIGFLLDAGTGNDTYDGNNGGAGRGGTGFLLDTGGSDTYESGNGGQNGGASGHSYGFLMDGGTGDDTYDAGGQGTNGGGWQNGRGFLVDAGGDDTYIAGSVATNGGATRERNPKPGGGGVPDPRKAKGFLLDVTGNDTYTAEEAAVNGGADTAVGLLYDNVGTDFYNTSRYRCRDCSDIPKGTVGAQVDRGSGPGSDRLRVGTPEVLVVDDDVGTANAECPDASYRAIQPAVNAAEYGDTVRVCAGTYPGNVTIDTTNVTLRAADSGPVVLDGEQKRRFGVALKGGQATVTGFTARNFTNTVFLAIGPETTVSHNVIRDSGGGVKAAGLYTDSLLAETPISQEEEATVIRNNTVTNATVGFGVVGTANIKVSRNTVRETPRGIFISRAGEVTVHDNLVSGQAVPTATEQRGISSVRSTEVTMTDNTVTGFTVPTRRRPAGTIADGIGIEIRNPRGRSGETTHTLRNNTMADNTYNLHVTSGRRSEYQHLDIGPTNTINGKPVLYLVGATNIVIGPGSADKLPIDSLVAADTTRAELPPLDAFQTPGYVACVSCTNVTIRDLDLGHNGQGVLIVKSSGMHIDNVTVHDTLQGISVQGSPSNTEVTHSTVQESFKGIIVRHNCANTADLGVVSIVRSPGGLLFGGDTETCAIPSVLVADNLIQHSGLLVNRNGFTRQKGTGITVSGTGVTVRGNTIRDGVETGIVMGHVSPPTTIQIPGPVDPVNLLPDSIPNPIVLGNTISLANSSVIDNRISNTTGGVTIHRTHGAVVGDNTISSVAVGFQNGLNSGLLYRNNRVTNATIGMRIAPTETDLTARNNSFRNVRWGLDPSFRHPAASVSHNIAPSNTVNGERILWVSGAVGRTIDASDANMVVCVNCVDVTVQDMTLTDNTHGVVLWESTGSSVRDVRVEDTLRTGVLIRGGQNITVANTTVIDSTLPIYTMPSPLVSSRVRRDIGRLAPTDLSDLPRKDSLLRQTLGSVRIINNRVLVDDASWITDQYKEPQAKPVYWGHFGIFLFNPTEATVTGNHIIGNRWGIFHFRGEVSKLRITNNTITHPRQEVGLGRFGGNAHLGGPLGRMLGIRVNPTDRANGSIVIRNNTLEAGTRPIGTQKSLFGILIKGKKVPSTTITDNSVQGYQQGVRVGVKSNNSTVSIRRNRLTGAKSSSVFVTGPTPGDAVEIHQNLLNPLRFGYGVKHSMGGGGGGHMMAGGGGSSGGHTAADHRPVDATCNRWAAPSGPSSRRHTLVDPVTGMPADGNGSTVSHGHMHGQSNVHFHPWIGESPGRTCSKELVGTKTPTPTPGPTRTPWPTAESGDGNGTGPGPGDGPGSGDGNDTGPGPGTATAAGGGEGTSTATARVAATDTPTGTPPPTATPEIVPGFGVGAWLVAFALLVAVLAARRRD